MKALTPALLAHYQLQVQTIATCWKVQRKDNTVFGFTNASTDLSISGLTYKASTGFTPSNVETSSEFNVDNLEVQGVLNSSVISEPDLLAGVWDYAKVSVFEVNYMDLSMGINPIRDGTLGQVGTTRNQFVAELRGLAQYLQFPAGESFGTTCNADFCDSRCKLSYLNWTCTGSVNSLSSKRTLNCTIQYPYWNYMGAKITITSGLNTGMSMEVRNSPVPGQLVLQELFPYDLQPGVTFSILAGCLKTRDACIAYGNLINFRGFPDLPGQDKMLSGT